MTTFSIAIRTVPARAWLFGQLIEQLTPTLTSPEVLGLSISANPDVAPNENGCRALEGAIAYGADWVLFLEDDAGPILDFIGSTSRWLNDWAEHDVHLYPLGTPLGTGGTKALHWPIEQFYCSVAMAIRGSMVRSLIDYLRANSHVRTGFDLMSGHWHRTVSKSHCLVAAQPCLVEHLGDDSTLIDTRPQRNVVGRFRGFISKDWSYRG